jgi:hypothetical protein
MVLERLGIGGRILVLPFGLLFGGIVLAAALAVGLGLQEAVRKSWESRARTPGREPDTRSITCKNSALQAVSLTR